MTDKIDHLETSIPQTSILIPAKNEAENLRILIEEIEQAMQERSFELIIINDGSTDHSHNLIKEQQATRPWLREICHRQSCGQSASIRTGLFQSKGEIIATLDGDAQNNPIYIPKLIDALIEGGPEYGIAAGQRIGRKASLAKRYSSRFANWLRRKILKDEARDTGCGLKAVRRSVFIDLPYFDSWHRYLPALVIREGYKVTFVDVIDRERAHGASNYGIFDRAFIGISDLLGVWWLRRRRKIIPEIVQQSDPDNLTVTPIKEVNNV